MGIKNSPMVDSLHSLQALAMTLHLFPKSDPVLMIFLNELLPLKSIARNKTGNDIIGNQIKKFQKQGHDFPTSMILLCIHWNTISLLEGKSVPWRKIRLLCKNAPDNYRCLQVLEQVAAWMEKESEKLHHGLTDWFSTLNSPFGLMASAKNGAAATQSLLEKITLFAQTLQKPWNLFGSLKLFSGLGLSNKLVVDNKNIAPTLPPKKIKASSGALSLEKEYPIGLPVWIKNHLIFLCIIIS